MTTSSDSPTQSNLVVRVLCFLAGLGLLLGFFLPWFRLADLAVVSGISLMLTSGAMVEALTGPSRGMLILIPVCGAALVATSVFVPRASAVAALGSGAVILLFGLFTLARVFLQTVGAGMWLVVASSLLAAGVGVAAFARRRASGGSEPT